MSNIDDSFKCVDCSVDTHIDNKDYYMVTDELWNKYGVSDKMLCLSCIEKRIGRKLTKEDFTLCPLNTTFNLHVAKILRGEE